MPINGCSQTLPAVIRANEVTAPDRHAVTLPMGACPGPARRASASGHGPPDTGGLGYAIRYFLAGKHQRAAMHMAKADARLGESMQRFIDRWSRRQIDELPLRDGAKLLKAACENVLERGSEPERPALLAMLHRCLATIKDPERLSQLYNDLAGDTPAARALTDQQASKLRDIARGMLDMLEQALAESLAARIGTPLFGRLLKTTGHTPADARQVRDTLEQLHGIGLWLSTPARTPARVLARMLDILTDPELGRLAAQAWPELAVRDQRYGAYPAEMNAAVAFIKTCEGDALAIWRDALRRQLDERTCLIAMQAAQTVKGAIDLNRLAEAMRAAYRQLDLSARTLTGLLHNTSLLRARVRADALAVVVNRLPDAWRAAGLRALRPEELSSLKLSLDAAHDMPALADASVSTTVEAVQADMLAADRRVVEEALAALHRSIARKQRLQAVTHAGVLGRAVQELCTTQAAFNVEMPADLAESLGHVPGSLRRLILGDGSKSGGLESAGAEDGGLATQIHALHGMSDAELGKLRTAVAALSRFGLVVDKRALHEAIRVRCGLPLGAQQTMDALAETLVGADAGIADLFARLRDVADVLVHVNRRRAAMGEDVSADSNAELVHDIAQPALERLARRNDIGRAGPGVAALRRLGLTGASLCDPLYAFADWCTNRSRDEAARVSMLTATLTMAWNMERYLYAGIASASDADPVDAGHAVDVDGATLRAAIAGELGVDWDGARGTATPCITPALHALFERHLAAPPVAGTLRTRPLRLYAADGTPSWFFVCERFADDMLKQDGMSLAVDGMNAHGVHVHSTGFSARLESDARRDAVAAALHALRELAGAGMPMLTQWLHRGIADAFAAALAASADGFVLYLPDGRRAGMPGWAADAMDCVVRREADGEYSVDTVLTWTGIGELPGIAAGDAVPVDSERSRIRASFTLAADEHGALYGLRHPLDIRYTLAALQ